MRNLVWVWVFINFIISLYNIYTYFSMDARKQNLPQKTQTPSILYLVSAPSRVSTFGSVVNFLKLSRF